MRGATMKANTSATTVIAATASVPMTTGFTHVLVRPESDASSVPCVSWREGRSFGYCGTPSTVVGVACPYSAYCTRCMARAKSSAE